MRGLSKGMKGIKRRKRRRMKIGKPALLNCKGRLEDKSR
jgi:hypothetical protein